MIKFRRKICQMNSQISALLLWAGAFPRWAQNSEILETCPKATEKQDFSFSGFRFFPPQSIAPKIPPASVCPITNVRSQ